jgi:high-affinity K+ transport system ATPase subunit B
VDRLIAVATPDRNLHVSGHAQSKRRSVDMMGEGVQGHVGEEQGGRCRVRTG